MLLPVLLVLLNLEVEEVVLERLELLLQQAIVLVDASEQAERLGLFAFESKIH